MGRRLGAPPRMPPPAFRGPALRAGGEGWSEGGKGERAAAGGEGVGEARVEGTRRDDGAETAEGRQGEESFWPVGEEALGKLEAAAARLQAALALPPSLLPSFIRRETPRHSFT